VYEGAQGGLDGLVVETEARGCFVNGEGTVGAGIAAGEFEDGRGVGREEGPGQAWGEFEAESVAIAGGVFNGDEALLAGDFDLQDAAGAGESVERFQKSGRGHAKCDFVARQIAEAEEEVVKAVGIAGSLILAEELEVRFNFGDRRWVEEFAKVGFAEEIGELGLIDGESSGAALGQGRVAVVDKVAGVSEQERACEGRRFLRVDDVHLDFVVLDGTEDIDERGHVEGVAKALAMGFEEHGEVGILRGDRKEIGSALALLPQGGAGLEAAAWQEQGAG
jgi:hypothetical protein